MNLYRVHVVMIIAALRTSPEHAAQADFADRCRADREERAYLHVTGETDKVKWRIAFVVGHCGVLHRVSLA